MLTQHAKARRLPLQKQRPLVRGLQFALAALAALGLLLLQPLSALACGGFYSTSATVYQDTERLILTVGVQDTTLYEQISYKGNASDFAWVLPVAATPQVSTASLDLFRALDIVTEPVFIPTTPPPCGLPSFEGSGGLTSSAPAPGNVNVYDSGTAGPYAYDVIGGSDPQALTSWLAAHHYHTPADLQSQIQPYVQAKMRFLAMRLRPKANIQDITPVKVVIPNGGQPQIRIPLRMAASSSSAHMGLLVWIFGASRYVPQNYQAIQVPDSAVSSDPFPGSNYTQVVENLVGKAGGHAFVTEYAKASSNLAGNPLLASLAQGHPYVTRLYSRNTPQSMQVDPVFGPQSGQPDVSNIHYLNTPNQCDPFNLAIGSLGATLGSGFYPVTCGSGLVVLLIVFLLFFMLRRRRRARGDPASHA